MKHLQKNLGIFWLITNQYIIMNLMNLNSYQNPVKMLNQNIQENVGINECVSFIVGDIFSGVTIQNIDDVLV